MTEHGCNLPTGLGKSLIFQALPLVIDHIEKQQSHICVVVSPLQLLSQVAYLRRKGVTAASIYSSCTEKKATLIEKVKVSVVFGFPEAWIKIERRRAMLGNSAYSNKLYALGIDEAQVIR